MQLTDHLAMLSVIGKILPKAARAAIRLSLGRVLLAWASESGSTISTTPLRLSIINSTEAHLQLIYVFNDICKRSLLGAIHKGRPQKFAVFRPPSLILRCPILLTPSVSQNFFPISSQLIYAIVGKWQRIIELTLVSLSRA